MTTERVQPLVRQLLDALGLSITCGSLTLNFNESAVQSVDAKEHLTLKKVLDRRQEVR